MQVFKSAMTTAWLDLG